MEKTKKESRKMNLAEAIIVFLICFAVIAVAAITGAFPIGMALLLAVVICGLYGTLVLHFSWDELFDSALKTISNVMFGILFCLSVGFVSASWIASGTIPFMMYWGLELINPQVFLLVAFVISALTSWLTGQAWTMVPSLGLAFMGIANALGIPAPMAAAAIASGCFIGDGASPLCEVPTIASISSGENNVMKTIKSMIPTLGTAIVATCVLYLVIGFGIDVETGQSSAVTDLQDAVSSGFNLSIITILPLVLVFVLVFVKFPILPAVVLGSLLGVVIAVLLQGEDLGEVINMMWNGYVCDSGNAELDSLLTRGGIMDFASTIIMMLFGFAFAGIIQKMGMLEAIMNPVLKHVKNRGVLILATSITEIITVVVSGTANVSSILNGSVYKDAYEREGLQPCNLARTMSMNGPFVCCMLPWTASGALCFVSLGVSNFAYWPYMFVFYISFLLNIIFGFMGKFTPTLDKAKTESA